MLHDCDPYLHVGEMLLASPVYGMCKAREQEAAEPPLRGCWAARCHAKGCWPSPPASSMDLATWAQQMQALLHPCILCLVSCLGTHCHSCDLLSAVQVFLNLVLEFVPETVYRISKHYSKNSQRMPTLFVKLYVYQVGACSSACCWHCCVPQLQQKYAHPACGVVLMVGEGGHPHNNSVRHSSPCCRWCCCVWRSSGVAGFRLLNVGLAGPGHICRQCVCVQTTSPPQFPCTADVHRCCTLSISGVCQPQHGPYRCQIICCWLLLL